MIGHNAKRNRAPRQRPTSRVMQTAAVLLGLTLPLALAGCQGEGAEPVVEGTLKWAEPAQQQPLQEARRKAQENLNQFIEALKDPRQGQRGFAIKAKFTDQADSQTDDQAASPGEAAVIDVEYMWVEVTEYLEDGDTPTFRGKLDNQPQILEGMKKGDEVTVDMSQVQDWIFLENGQRKGGWSIDVLLAPPDEESSSTAEGQDG